VRPINTFQRNPNAVNISSLSDISSNVHLNKVLSLFLSQAGHFKDNELFMNDLRDLATYYFSALADDHVKKLKKWASQKSFKKANAEMQQVKNLLSSIDLILSGNPIDNLDRWISLAKAWGHNKKQKDYYAADAKRIITYWGSYLNDYAARLWSGLIKNYYLGRWEAWYHAQKKGKKFNAKAWEKKWVETPGDYHSRKVKDPNAIISLIKKLRKEYK
jgi:alpha-N-acetylglucosaminidase